MKRKLLLPLVAAAVVVGGLVYALSPSAGHSGPVAFHQINLDADGGAPAPITAATPRPRRSRDPRSAGPQPSATRPPRPTPTARPTPTLRPARPKYLVLFVLDGAQPSYYTVSGIPHIRALMRGGADFTNGFAGILESETPSGHAAIASGSPPNADGILSFAWANSDNNTTVDLFNPANIRNGQMEQIMRQAPASDIGELVHRSNPKAEVVALGGHKYYAQDALGGPSANAIVYYQTMPNGTYAPVAVPRHVPPASILTDPALAAKSNRLPIGAEDHLVMKLVEKTFLTMRPQVIMTNIPEFDWPLGHPHGAGRDPAGVKLLMRGFDADLGALEYAYRRAGILDQTLFVLTSDHGFTPIYRTVSSSDIEHAVIAAGTTIVSDTFHTAGYIWVHDPAKAAAAAANVAKLGNPYIQSVYFEEQIPGGGYDYIRASGSELFHVPATETANQYLLGSFAGPNGPDVVVFFTEEAASLPGGEASWKGDHGGADWDAQHLRIIMSGPGIRPGTVSAQPAPLMDIAPTVLSLMGITPTGMRGVPLTDGMLSATTAQRDARSAQTAKLTPVIQALYAESHAEVRAGQ